MTAPQLTRARLLLCDLQNHIRDTILAARAREASKFARIAAVTAADTIYHIDKLSEHAIIEWFEKNWPRSWPVELVMEGIEDGHNLTFPFGTPVARTDWKCILDPIDGTRGLMYDKRSAWILAGLAPQRGPRTTLRDIAVAAMTELPTSKQWRADQFSAIRGGGPRGVLATAVNILTGKSTKLSVRPSQARDFKHGFACVSKFFPDGKTLLAAFEEKLWAALHPPAKNQPGVAASVGDSPLVFDDQYISTGGQLYELLAGHDRLIADLRPLVFKKLGLHSSLVCHPYDICTALILTEAGGLVENPLNGAAVTTPLDTTSAVTWIGYANPSLAKLARPIVKRLLGAFA
ncbi:inositol monophosphatase [Nibricoccus aquaticus]|uniref:Inositol monophosphatase n=1 Tax=Nibricoccus aquaticus TaxID=2576891 RepID=A0A290Q591_9BACT|nr:inositol monophosphatase [Nibricoccus aquaticus]ATC63603.1 inositol monophosphatase [Nibricoccus aquaticus]